MMCGRIILALFFLFPYGVSYSPNLLSLKRNLGVEDTPLLSLSQILGLQETAIPHAKATTPFPPFLHPSLVVRVKRSDEEAHVRPDAALFPAIDVDMDESHSDQEQEEEGEKECYFAHERKSPSETRPRPTASEVKESCGGKLTRMSELIDEQYPNQHGSPNKAALVLSRGAGEFIDWKDENKVEEIGRRYICDKHERELGSNWGQKQYHHFKIKQIHGRHAPRPVCSMPNPFFQHEEQTTLFRDVHYIEAEEAEAILIKRGILLHPGLPICQEHDKQARKITAHAEVEDAGHVIRPPPIGEDFSQTPTITKDVNPFFDVRDKNDPNYHMKHVLHPMGEDSKPDVPSDQKKKAFMDWMRAIGISPHISTNPWHELTERSRRRQSDALQYATDEMAKLINPNNPQALKDKTFKLPSDYERPRTDDYEQMMLNVKEAIYSSDSRADRLAYLSIVATSFRLSEIQRYIPGLSRYFYNQAKSYALRGYKNVIGRFSRIKYNFAKVERFIEFITSYKVTVGLPYGTRRVRDTRDTQMAGNSQHNETATELEDRGEHHLLLPESTARKMIDICKAERRKSLHGVDLTVADAMEAFDNAEELLDKMLEANWIDKSWHASLRMKMLQSRQYLRTDYLIHVKENSTISDHCWSHALSDLHDFSFQKDCDKVLPPWKHRHSRVCDKCENLQMFFGDLRETLETIESKSYNDESKMKEIKMIRRDYYDWEDKIEKLKAHQLRTAKSEHDRQTIIKNLKEGEVLMTLDFAMKHMPLHPRESTVDWYGQRGMPWHITHVTTPINEQYYQHNLVHIFKGERQDSATVTAVLRHDLEELKKRGIKRVYLRSDQAGTYKSSSTLSSVWPIADEVGIEVVGWYFSEAQAGKGPCDLTSARCKRKTRSCADAKKKVLNPNQFFDVSTTGKLLDGVSYYLVTLEGSGKDKKPAVTESKIHELSKYNAFTFEKKSLRVHRFWNIGTGKTFSYKQLQPNDARLVVEKSGGTLSDDKFWQKMGDARYVEKEEPKEEEENDVDQCDTTETSKCAKMPKMESRLYRCPIETCSKEFISEAGLERHMLVGTHLRKAEKMNELDYALNRFSAFLEIIAPQSTCPVVNEVTLSQAEDTNNNGVRLPMGWAIPVRRRSVRFPDSVKKFLKKLYDAGEKSGVKTDAHAAAALMRAEKTIDGDMLFEYEHLLNSRQIAGVYTGFKKAKLDKRDKVKQPKSRAKRFVEEDEEERDEVNDLFKIEGDPELEYKTEPLFDHADDLRIAIGKEYDDLFDGVEEDEDIHRGWMGGRGC